MFRKAAVLGVLISGATPLAALAPGDSVAVPSGQQVSLIEILPDSMPDGRWLRLRFLAGGIADDGVSFDVAADDMLYLCQIVGLPLSENLYPDTVRFVVSLSDRPVEFGVQDPDATQFFEAYTFENGDCIWEEF